MIQYQILQIDIKRIVWQTDSLLSAIQFKMWVGEQELQGLPMGVNPWQMISTLDVQKKFTLFIYITWWENLSQTYYR